MMLLQVETFLLKYLKCLLPDIHYKVGFWIYIPKDEFKFLEQWRDN